MEFPNQKEYSCDCDPPGVPATEWKTKGDQLPLTGGKLCDVMSLTKADKVKFLKAFDTILFDCDGVLWRSGEEIAGASTFVNSMRKKGKRIIFLTNNSTRSRTKHVEVAKKYGFHATEAEFISTAYLAAQYLAEIGFDTKKRVYVVGCDGITDELKNVGIQSFGVGNLDVGDEWHQFVNNLELERDVGAVVVGFDPYYSFAKIATASSYLLRRDILFVATNMDEAFPHKNKTIAVPGSGVMVNGVSTAINRQPDIILGKPSKYMAASVQNAFDINLETTLMVGDRANTDILFGNRMGVKTLLVLTGITSLEESKVWLNSLDSDERELVADYYVKSIGDFNIYLDEF